MSMANEWHLQILRTTWVLWGYGDRSTGIVQVARAELPLRIIPGRHLTLLFKLPPHRDSDSARTTVPLMGLSSGGAKGTATPAF